LSVGPQRLGGKSYPDAIRLACPAFDISDVGTTVLYADVAGYQALTLTIGIPDGTATAPNGPATIQFYKDADYSTKSRLGGRDQVSPGSPETVTIPLQGTGTLSVTCAAAHGADRFSGHGGDDLDVVIVNATLST
jgi:hypothetical protein